jgi:hypothetical protein
MDGHAAWVQVGEQMANSCANVESQAQSILQEGERDDVNP